MTTELTTYAAYGTFNLGDKGMETDGLITHDKTTGRITGMIRPQGFRIPLKGEIREDQGRMKIKNPLNPEGENLIYDFNVRRSLEGETIGTLLDLTGSVRQPRSEFYQLLTGEGQITLIVKNVPDGTLVLSLERIE